MSKIKCLAPWVHSHVSTSSKALCCISSKFEPFEEHDKFWNGEYLTSVRRKFLKGESVEECSACFGSSANKDDDSRYFKDFERNYGQYEEEILSSTDENGVTTFEPISIDFRHSLCNLKCKTCNTGSSSSISAASNKSTKQKVFPIINFKDVFVDHERDLERIIGPKTLHIYWAGGEPLMSPVYWNTINRMVAAGLTNTRMTYNTNATKLSDQKEFDKAVTAFKAFNSHVAISIDGIGEINEYIRAGTTWSDLDPVIRRLIAELGRYNVSLDFTLTNLGLLQLPKIIKYVIDVNVGKFFTKALFEYDGFKKCGEYHNANTFLSISLIKPDVFDKVYEEVKDLLKDSEVETNVIELLDFVRPKCIGREFTTAEKEQIENYERRHGDVISIADVLKA